MEGQGLLFGEVGVKPLGEGSRVKGLAIAEAILDLTEHGVARPMDGATKVTALVVMVRDGGARCEG